MNAYEVKAGIGVIAGKTVIHASAPCVYYKNERYYTYTYTFTFYLFLTDRSGISIAIGGLRKYSISVRFLWIRTDRISFGNNLKDKMTTERRMHQNTPFRSKKKLS